VNISLNPSEGISLKLITPEPNRSSIWIWTVAATSNNKLLFSEEGPMEAVVGWIVVVFQNLHPESDLLRARTRLQEVRMGEIEERRMMVTCEAWKWLKEMIK
jgi:hypothetical protein